MVALLVVTLSVGAERFEPPMPAPVALRNAGFEDGLEGSWTVGPGSAPGVRRDRAAARCGGYGLSFHNTGGRAAVSLDDRRLVPAKPGEAFKFAAWVKTTEAVAHAQLVLEGTGDGKSFHVLQQGRPLKGKTPGWVYRWVVAAVPDDGSITHVRPALHCHANTGTAWFDDVALARLPPDRPIVTEMPFDPPFGRIRARGGHLVGSDGKRVRLWGMNCVDEPGRTYREMTYIAHRVKQMGFNAVRLHLYDVRFIDRDAKDERGEATSVVFQRPERGDGSLLDKLDYFIYCLQREGLYLYMTFDRMRCKFRPGDYHVLPSDGPDDERAWKAAVDVLQPDRADEHAYFVDRRLAEAQARFVRQLLDHRNVYTGRRVADDPNVALYELTNENHFPEWMLTGGFRKWPPYFQDVLRTRWNTWLKARYGDDDELREAWTKLGESERLSPGTVRVAPTLGEASQHTAERLADVHRFVNHLFVDYSRRLERIIRESGARAVQTPVSWDTLHEHKHKWYYPCSLAGLMTVGTYVQGPAKADSGRRRLHPGFRGFYNLSFASVLDKPTVVYENNTLKPDCWRADYPMIISAFTSTHDWDGVFWYTWGVLRIDTPQAKAVVGFWGDEATFNDGVSVRLRGELSPQFACFGIASTDETALAESSRAVLVLTTYGENRGRVLRDDPESVPGNAPLFAKRVKSWGSGPPDIARPGARIALGGEWRWRLVDFRLRVIAQGKGQVLEIPSGTPVFLGELER